MLRPGDIFSHYRIEEIIGEGGMGVVYKAVDLNLDRPVALKLISEKLAQSEDYRRRLTDEARNAALVQSPHVVAIFEQGEHQGRPFIAMEYVAGEDLRTATSGYGLEQKIEIGRQIAEGIKAAHSVGLIHRDLKPENIKLTTDRQIKIFDFGLAKTVRPDTVDEKGKIEGTLHYLSPEQLSGEPLTFSSDLFSFGTILFELFAGERPFEGEYAESIIYSILYEDPPAPCAVNSEVPDWVEAMVLKLLRKPPAERFASIDAVLDHIEACLAGDTTRYIKEKLQQRQTVTVIDVKNLSGDDSWNYFCTGFTEDVINEISRRTNLVVSAQPSTAAPRNVREIFRHCRSDYVIVGSLMKWQDNIKLNLSTYGDHGDKVVFGKSYHGPAQDLFKLLSEGAGDVAAALAERTGFSFVEVEDYLKTDISAYEYYLKGKTYYHNAKRDDQPLAIRMFTKALEIDPNYALAHSGLADVYAFQYMCYYDRTPERINAAKEEALKAIDLDPRLPEAQRALGRCFQVMEDYALAEKSFLKAVEINPKYAIGYRTLAWLKSKQGDNDQAIHWAKKALELAPTDLETLLLLSLVNMDVRKYTLAMATLQRAIELGPDYGRAYYNLGAVYFKLGVPDLALENFHLAIKYKGDPNCYVDAGFVHMISSQPQEARTDFCESIAAGYLSFVAYYYLGYLEKLGGNAAAATDNFNKAIEAGRDIEQKEPGNLYAQVYSAMALAAVDRTDEAQKILARIESSPCPNGEVLYSIARVYALLGDVPRAKESLDRALRHPDGPTEKEIRLDPHFTLLND